MDGNGATVLGGRGDIPVSPAPCQRSLEGEPVANLCPIQRLHILLAENMWGIFWNVSLPSARGAEICKL